MGIFLQRVGLLLDILAAVLLAVNGLGKARQIRIEKAFNALVEGWFQRSEGSRDNVLSVLLVSPFALAWGICTGNLTVFASPQAMASEILKYTSGCLLLLVVIPLIPVALYILAAVVAFSSMHVFMKLVVLLPLLFFLLAPACLVALENIRRRYQIESLTWFTGISLLFVGFLFQFLGTL